MQKSSHYLVMVTAAKLLHRFYTQHSFQDYPSSVGHRSSVALWFIG